MGKWISILLGLVLIALGIWGIVADIARKNHYLWPFIYSGLVILAILVGLGALAFGISEVRSAADERRMAEPAAPQTPPPPPAAPPGGEQKTS